MQLAETTASYSRATNLLYADKNLKTLENIVEYSGLDVQSKSFSRMGGRIWNSIPTELREKPKNHFKKVLHRKLLQILEKKDDYIDILTIQKEIAII